MLDQWTAFQNLSPAAHYQRYYLYRHMDTLLTFIYMIRFISVITFVDNMIRYWWIISTMLTTLNILRDPPWK